MPNAQLRDRNSDSASRELKLNSIENNLPLILFQASAGPGLTSMRIFCIYICILGNLI